MNNFKSTLTCRYCSKIFKEPIQLPCSHHLCKTHLTEKDIVNKDRIKCVECGQDFKVNDFKTNEIIKKQLDEFVYLSDEELLIKKHIEESIQMLFQIYEKFTFNKTTLDLDVHEHYQEIRFKLDEHRERLKEQIDDIYMDMIDKTKKMEATYLKCLEDKLAAPLKSFETNSLQERLKETADKFRNPNIMTESVLELQRQQDVAIAELKLKLDEQSKVMDNLIIVNQFKPNLSFNQDSFGFLYLNEYSIDQFKSQIISGKQSFDLLKVCEFSLKDKWTLLYRGTRDGFGVDDFHLKCDGRGKTLTLLKAHGSSYVFGGFTSTDWDSSDDSKSDPDAFLFSLTNKDNQPSKLRQLNTTNSIFCSTECGPIFGSGHGHDLLICDLANSKMGSYVNLGNSYQHPQPSQGDAYLAGSEFFLLSEIEVYQKE